MLAFILLKTCIAADFTYQPLYEYLLNFPFIPLDSYPFMLNCDQSHNVLADSAFVQGLQQIKQQAGQYCNLEISSDVHVTGTWWSKLRDLIDSGYENFSSNYELLISGEIGAIFMVAFVPLLLGLFIEVGLIMSHRRKDQLSNSSKRLELINANKGVLASQLEENQAAKQLRFKIGYWSVGGVQALLIGFFMFIGPEYDRGVWCEEYRTQFSILTSGLETERLQADQRRANCEIRQAVDTLRNIFSKENKNTIHNIKHVSAQLDGSVKKLDKANESIDDFKIKVEKATENTEDVLKTLTIMESMAAQLGLSAHEKNEGEQPHKATKNLPQRLTDIEGILSQQPNETWLKDHVLSQQTFKSEFNKGLVSQQENNQLLDELSVQQALMTQQLDAVSAQLLSKELIDAIAQKVVDQLSQKTTYSQWFPAGQPSPISPTNSNKDILNKKP